jgi:hypothetical protein
MGTASIEPAPHKPARSLRRHLAAAIVLKLVLLFALWLTFFSGERPPPDADQVARHLSSGVSAPFTPPTSAP